MTQYRYITHFNGGRFFLVLVESSTTCEAHPVEIEAISLKAYAKVNGEFAETPCFEVRGNLAHTFYVWIGEDSQKYTPIGHEILLHPREDNEVFVNGAKLDYNSELTSYDGAYYVIGHNINRFKFKDIGVCSFITRRGPNDVPYSWIVGPSATYLTDEHKLIPNYLRDERYTPHAQYYGHYSVINPIEKSDEEVIAEINRVVHIMIREAIDKNPTPYEIVFACP